ncbi:macrolide family glycosyltransferase [Streptomyces abikoensis]|uniref:macrolide family glycosyltransferase n=1 Tax=Streptomyces abikoensis TaxID=97398 RepID=UPI00368D1789
MTSPFHAGRTGRPAHIAMFSVGAHGHVNPSLEVIRELVTRGHRVTYAIPGSFAGTVAATGAEPRVYSSTLPPGDDPAAWGGELIDHLRLFLADAGQALPQLLKAYEGDRPDLVLYDPMAYAARVLAQRWGVPAVQLSPHAVAWEGYEEEVAAEMSGALPEDPCGAPRYSRSHAWLANNGISIGPGRIARRPERCIALISEVLQPNAHRVDPAVYTFTGPCRPEGDEAGDGWARPAGTKRVLLISLGTLFTRAPEFYRACVAAFGGLPGWHVVLRTGKGVDRAELGEVPGNVEVRDWVPQQAILGQADVFITHAGAGSAHEGLAHGVPMVAVPQAADQFGNAEMLVELGVARRLAKEEATPETLREAVLALAGDPDVAARGAAIRRRMAAEGGTRRAADLVEAELPGRRPGTPSA